MRRAWILVALVLLAGCGGGDDQPAPPGQPPMGGDEKVIRGWIGALNDRKFDEAADYFAKGAIVEQQSEFRLRDHAAAVEFNRSLPCTADLTRVSAEGTTSLGYFRLSGGTGGCGGSVRVRFLIVDGKIRQWRQLAPQPAPQGQTV